MFNPIKKLCGFFKKNVYDEFRQNIGKPRYLAMSFGQGMFYTLLPLPLQASLCFLIWLVLRKWKYTNFNVAIAMALTVISNPFTDPFFFYAYYLFGVFLLGMDAFSFEAFIKKFEAFSDEKGTFFRRFDAAANFVMDDVGFPILLGSIIISIAGALICYFLVFFISKLILASKRIESDLDKNSANQSVTPAPLPPSNSEGISIENAGDKTFIKTDREVLIKPNADILVEAPKKTHSNSVDGGKNDAAQKSV